MGSTGSEHPATMGDVFEWATRRWWMVLLALVLGGGAGWLAADVQPKTYVSTTSLEVLSVGSDATGARLNLDTEAQLVKSINTANRAHDLMGATVSAADLRRRVDVRVPPNTTFLEISFEASSPARAQEGSAAFARAYLDQREASAQRFLQERIARLNQQIDTLIEEKANDQVIVPLQNQLQLLQTQSTRGGEIWSPANLPTFPTYPNVMLFTVSGMIAGLLLGLSGALLIHRLDTRIFKASDLPEAVADQVLVELKGSRPHAQVVGPATPLGRQFSRLRNVMRASTDIESSSRSRPAGVLLVCGATAGSATGFATANLAAAFARAGDRVIVVGGDPASSVFEALGVSTVLGYGLPDVFNGVVTPAEAAVPSPLVDKVSVLLPGKIAEGDELPVAEMVGLVLRLASFADRLIIETAPMSRAIDAQAISVAASALLLVVECQRTRTGDVAPAVRDFHQVNAPLAGVLLVPPASRSPMRRRARPQPKISPSFIDAPEAAPVPVSPAQPGPVSPAPSGDAPTAGRLGPPTGSDEDVTTVLPRIQSFPEGYERVGERRTGSATPTDKS